MESQEPNTKATGNRPADAAPTSKHLPSGDPPKRWTDRVRNETLLAFVGLAIVGCLIVIPRPTYPQIVPLPRIDSDQLERRERLEIQRALRARDGSLDKEARAVGEQVRRLGAVLATGGRIDSKKLEMLQKDAELLTQRKDKEGTVSGIEALLQLRALQGQMFLEAVRKWLQTKEKSADLAELGGPFHQIATSGWLDENGNFALTQDELRLFFRAHWGLLTNLDEHEAFELSLEEKRRYYSTNLRHPANPPGDVHGRARTQLGFAAALGKVDASYPSHLARGIFLLKLGDALNATQALKLHLQEHPNGPWAQIARNHLLSAAQRANSYSGAGL